MPNKKYMNGGKVIFLVQNKAVSRAQQRVEGIYQHGYRAEGQARLKGLQTSISF